MTVNIVEEFSIIEIKLGQHSYPFQHDITPFNAQSSGGVVVNQQRAIHMLRRAGAPVKSQILTPENLKQVTESLNNDIYPVSIIPAPIFQTKYDTLNDVKNRHDLTKACHESFEEQPYVILEPYREKYKRYRALYFYGTIIALLELSRPTVTGDGINTLETLIQKKNGHREKLTGQAYVSLIPKDKNILFNLHGEPWSLDSIIHSGRDFVVGYHHSPDRGGETQLVPVKLINKRTLKYLKDCAKFSGLNFVALEFTCRALESSLGSMNGYITNMIPDPDISIFQYPTQGNTIDIADILLSRILRHAKSPWIRML